MKIFQKSCFLLSFTICCHWTIGQKQQLNFTNYTSRQGLSSGIIYDILKDSYGFLWLATEDGLNRFDGSNFKVYRSYPNGANSLSTNQITSLYESRDGCIWVGTNGGSLCYYDRTKDSLFQYKSKTGEPLTTAITSVQGDKNGNVWVTGYGTAYIIDPRTKELIKNSPYNELIKTIERQVSHAFLQDSKHRVWLGTDKGLYSYDESKHTLRVFTHVPDDTASLPNNTIMGIEEDKNGNIWVITNNGLGMFLPATGGFRNYRRESSVNKISSNLLYDIKVDNSNRLWIGTENGLDILDIQTNKVINYGTDKRDPRSLSNSSIRSIFIDDNGLYWIGTFRGGLNKYDENANHFNLKAYNAFDPFGLRSPMITSFAPYGKDVFIGTDGGGLQLFHRSTNLLDPVNLPVKGKSEKNDLTILSQEMDAKGQLWVGTFRDGLFCYNPANKTYKHYKNGDKPGDLNSNDIFCLMQDGKGNIWIGTNGGGVNVIAGNGSSVAKYVHEFSRPADPARPSSNFIRCFEEDSEGKIWIGTFGAGISVFNPATRQFQFYNKGNSGLPGDYVFTIKEDDKGNIWTGTCGNGIGLLKKGDNQFQQFTEKDGLRNNVINMIMQDGSGKIWASTNNGLSCYDPQTNKFKNYTEHDGLQTGSFLPGAGLMLVDGTFFLGGQHGFNYFDPSALKTNRNFPKLALTDLKIDNQYITPSAKGPIDQSILTAQEIHLKYKQAFSIGFEALSFTVPEANRYEYQLEGFDKIWVGAGKDHSAYYANIPPGEYTFRVRAGNNDGIWNMEGRSIKVLVAPPFWLTKLAYLIYLLIIGGILYYLRQLSIKKIQQKYSLELERQQAKQLIERERKEAEYLRNLDQQKIKFLTNLSHEFRTPISLIMGPVDNLLTQTKEIFSINQLKLIKRNSRRLLNLVNQLLDFRKMEEGELKLQPSEGNISLFVKDVCDSFNDMAFKKRISFGCYVEPASLYVLFDHNKLERILFNLLSNAFKFTPEKGNIAVTLTQVAHAADNDFATICIAVKDSGIGISEDAHPHVFDSFFQQNTSSEILNHGTGIGLSIVKEFINLHGGEIWLESEEGKGSEFTLRLTLEKVEQTVETPVSETSSDESKEVAINGNDNSHITPSIMVIEDDDDFRFYIRENLKQTYRIFEAPNGKEGWQRILFHHPDIIVSDIQMPVMDGLQLVKKLKADKRTSHIPVILLTAGNAPTGVLDGLETGAIDYITKPFDFAVLQAKIHNILLLNKSFKETYSKQVTIGLPKTEVVSAKDKFLQTAISFIYENLKSAELSVELLSKQLLMSRVSLYTKVLEYTGMTPVEFIRSVKLEKAKDLLENSDLTINEIAFELGFANPNYFTKVFRKVYDKSPSEFQRKKT